MTPARHPERRAFATLAVALLALPLVAAAGTATNETGVDVRAWYDVVGGAKPDLTGAPVSIEIVDTASGLRLATDDATTRARICRSGDPNDVCVPPGGDHYRADERNRAYASLQPGEWSEGDELVVTIRMGDGVTMGEGRVTLAEGGVVVDVVIVRPPDSISLLVYPTVIAVKPDAVATYSVRVTNDRPFMDTIDLALVNAPPTGWVASLDPPRVTLAPGETSIHTLTVDTPIIDQIPYADGVRGPASWMAVVRAVPQNATHLARVGAATTLVPLTIEIVDPAPKRPLLVLQECVQPNFRASLCYPDPTQRIEFDVKASWADGSPAQAVEIRTTTSYQGLLTIFGYRDDQFHVTDANGRVHIALPYSARLPIDAGPLDDLNWPGRYQVVARGLLHDHTSVAYATIGVGPVS